MAVTQIDTKLEKQEYVPTQRVPLRAHVAQALGGRYRWLIWSVLTLVAFNQNLAMFAYSVLVPSLLEELNLSYALAGTLSSAYMLAMSAMMIPFGSIGDRIGGRRLLIISLTAMSVGALLFATAQSFEMALISRLLVGAGAAAGIVLPAPMLAFWFFKEQFRSVNGLHVGVGKTGSIVATWVLPPLIVAFGWRLGYGLVSLITPIALLACILFLANGPAEVGLAHRQGMAISRPKGEKPQPTAPSMGLMQVIRNRNVVLMALTQTFVFGAYYGIVNWLPTYFKDVLGGSEVEAGFQTGFLLWGTIIGFAFSGYLANYLGGARPIYSAGALGVTLFCVLFASGVFITLPSVVWPLVMLGFGLCLSIMVLMTMIIATLVPVSALGAATGFAFTVSYIGAMISPPIVGAIADATGSLGTAFWVTVVSAAIAFVISLLVREGRIGVVSSNR